MGMSSGPSTSPNINVTPLIDVLLVLIIIFMVVAPSKPSKFETKIPQKPQNQDQVVQPPEDLLMVTIGANRELQLNSQKMDHDELGKRLTSELENRPDKTVFIKAPQKVPYSDVVRVLDVVKGAGAEPIGLQVDFLEE
jgi:biopolymer transport protein ExbD